MAEQIILLRHGETGSEYQKRYIGWKDISLAEPGRRNVEALTEMVRLRRPSLCLCSTLRRCRESAEIVAGTLGIPVYFNPDLKEIDFGDWEGLSFQEIAAADPEHVLKWARFKPDFSFPGGESITHFLDRVGRIAKCLTEMPEKEVLVCTHGGMIRGLICHFLGLEPCNYLSFEVSPASLTTLALNGAAQESRGILSSLNQRGRPA